MVQALAKFSTYPSACLNFVDLSLDQRRRSSSRHNMGLIVKTCMNCLGMPATLVSWDKRRLRGITIRIFIRLSDSTNKYD